MNQNLIPEMRSPSRIIHAFIDRAVSPSARGQWAPTDRAVQAVPAVQPPPLSSPASAGGGDFGLFSGKF